MSASGSPPPLNKTIFVLADLALLGAAWLIAEEARHPLGEGPMVLIAGCVLAAAFIGAFPFVLDYTRRQELAVEDRQRSLEALARTIATAGEQIGIAAAGLNTITEKVAELERKADASRSEEQEEMERELSELRATESERLSGIAEKISRAASDWAKVESTGLRHVVAAKTFIAELDAKIAALKTAAAALTPPASSAAMPAASARRKPLGDTFSRAATAAIQGAPRRPSPAEPEVSIAPPPPAPDFSVNEAPPAAAPDSASSHNSFAAAAERGSGETPLLRNPAAGESDPPPQARSGSALSRAAEQNSTSTFSAAALDVPDTAASIGGIVVTEEPEDGGPIVSEPAPRKRPARTAPVPEPSLGLDDASLRSAAAGPVPAPSPDGATRLFVTAYIGIGNRLFIRGEGPGLSWDEGVPLQFVSIGKWRWETPAATAPVRFKLYKNDRDECRLPVDTLGAGQQQEVLATFS